MTQSEMTNDERTRACLYLGLRHLIIFPGHSSLIGGYCSTPLGDDKCTSAVEVRDCPNHIPLRFSRNFRINRQRQCLACGALRLGEIALPVAEIGKTVLLMEREWIVNRRLNFAFAEMLTQCIAHWRANNV